MVLKQEAHTSDVVGGSHCTKRLFHSFLEINEERDGIIREMMR